MAAGATYEPIATTTLGSAAATITFSSIPSTYTDLRLVMVAQSVSGGTIIYVTYNASGGTAYSQTDLYGLGAGGTPYGSQSTTSTSRISLANISGLSTTIPTMYTLDVFSYAGSTYKTCLATQIEDKNGSGAVANTVGLWRNTSAISSIELTKSSGNFTAGTTATLYGIKAA